MLALTQSSAVLVTLPSWVTVVFFALAMVGFAGWNTAWGRRIALTAAMYVAAFSIVGQDFNTYWGQMVAPLMCFGVVRSRGSTLAGGTPQKRDNAKTAVGWRSTNQRSLKTQNTRKKSKQ